MVYFIIGLLLGCIVVYAVTRQKLKDHIQLNEKTAQQNQEIKEENTKLLLLRENYKEQNQTYQQQTENYRNNLKQLEEQAQSAADTFYKDKMKIASERAVKAGAVYDEAIEDCKNQYLEILADNTKAYADNLKAVQIALEEKEKEFADLEKKVAAAVEAEKRAELAKSEKDFYRLNISEQDIEEIKKLRSVIPYLRNAEPLNKVIWKTYYEKPYTDLAGRVVGNKVKTGIYKITNIENGMCYVGQAVNIADRWRQHIKRGIGAETPTRNKLYPAMLAIGVENFTFEIVEECDASMLNEREQFWQEYFKAKEFGYSIK